MAEKRRKRQTWKDGDLFLVPLADGGRVLGQVLFSPGPLHSAFSLGRTAPEWNLTLPKMEEVVAIQLVTCVALNLHDVGYWAVVGHAPFSTSGSRSFRKNIGHEGSSGPGCSTPGS